MKQTIKNAMQQALKNYFPFLLAIVFAVSIAMCNSKHSLSKGQVIKQFFSYSISQSLFHNGFQVFKTTLPCLDKTEKNLRQWAEEPPVFHFLAALPMTLGISNPAFMPLVSYLLLLIGILFLLKEIGLLFPLKELKLLSGKQSVAIFFLTSLTPVLLRYSIQHMPDLMACAWLVFAAVFLLKRKHFLCILFLTLAVTTKAVIFIPALAFLSFSYFFDHIKKPWFFFASLIIIASPFVLWLTAISSLEIPNPFIFEHFLENRHSGQLLLLIEPRFWIRFFTWSASKGVGWILFIGFLLYLFSWLKKKHIYTREEKFLLLWSFSFLVSWIVIRQGNFVHDYYFLPFSIPIAILGSLTLLKITNKIILISLTILSIGYGIYPLFKLSPVSDQPPKFCQMEQR
ncbi:MAG: hypothetical protein HY843_01145 [Bdellovibrio sp.]|nr:hypothetical protein [Bdellovibrio sp.]